jgi:glycosyltransferase involved in cell wall biosynthesis
MRLHLLGLAHTITRDEFSHCAFTGKVQRFAPMMRSLGYEVFHYGVAGAESGADRDIDLLTEEEFTTLRKSSYKFLQPTLTDEEIEFKLTDNKQFIGDLANYSAPIYKLFNHRLRDALLLNYRSTSTDIVCLTFGPAHEEAIKDLHFVCVESGIGYPNAYKNYRIYESYAKMHYEYSRCSKHNENYWFVCPNYYNLNEWPLSLKPVKKRFGFFGRIGDCKGLWIVVEIAKKFPDCEFIICGQGDPAPFLAQKLPNLIYKAPIHGKVDRGEYLGSLTALIAPSKYLEPFCGVSAEAQLCGTPVISHDYGAFVENIEQFKTGLRCRTLADFSYGIRMALDGKFDRSYIRKRAIDLFDMYNVAHKYDYAFKTIINVHNGTNGWYSENVAIDLLLNEEERNELNNKKAAQEEVSKDNITISMNEVD